MVPNSNIEPAMRGKTLKKYSEYDHRLTYRSLSDDGLKDLKQIFNVKTNNLVDESHPLNLVDEVTLANQFN